MQLIGSLVVSQKYGSEYLCRFLPTVFNRLTPIRCGPRTHGRCISVEWNLVPSLWIYGLDQPPSTTLSWPHQGEHLIARHVCQIWLNSIKCIWVSIRHCSTSDSHRSSSYFTVTATDSPARDELEENLQLSWKEYLSTHCAIQEYHPR
jgi:hypothetical protein